MSIHSNPTELARALGKASKKIKAVTYDYPGFWTIRTAQDTYLLGDSDNFTAWNNEEGNKSHATTETNPEFIALAFASWLEKVEAN